MGEVLNKIFYTGGRGGELCPMVQPHSLLHIIIYHFGQQRYPFHIPYIDKWYPLFVLFIYFATQNIQRKKV